MELKFTPGSHAYELSGRQIPSVTQTIALATDASHFTDDCRWRGSAVHAATQYLDEGCLDWDSVEPGHQGYVRAWERCKAETGMVIEGIEEMFWHQTPGGPYAGQRDRRIRIGQSRGVLDLKTGALYPQTALQTAAYTAPLDSPRAYRRFAVRLKPDGTYTIKEYPVAEYMRDWNRFLVLLSAWQIRREFISH